MPSENDFRNEIEALPAGPEMDRRVALALDLNTSWYLTDGEFSVIPSLEEEWNYENALKASRERVNKGLWPAPCWTYSASEKDAFQILQKFADNGWRCEFLLDVNMNVIRLDWHKDNWMSTYQPEDEINFPLAVCRAALLTVHLLPIDIST